MIEFPRKGVWSLGFLTNDGLEEAKIITGKELESIFIPTTPNPTNGFIIMLPVEDVTELDLSIEDGFKFIISMGVVVPDGQVKENLIAGKLAQTLADS